MLSFGWHHQDYALDSVYGISLNKWYNEDHKKVNNKIIVATLDSQIDIDHESLNGKLWVNNNEIPNNGIDDDKNGYIDDVNGWNFIGKPDGGYFRYGNFEYTKVVRKYQEYFKDKKEVPPDSVYLFNEYKRASKLHNAYSGFYKNWLKSLVFSAEVEPISRDTLKYFFPKEDYSIGQLDSLYKIYKINDKTYRQRRDDNDRDLGALIYYKIANIEVGNKNLDDIVKSRDDQDSTLNRNLNVEYDPRLYIKDNPNVLEKGYGNNVLNNNTFQLGHHTATSSIIVANRKNKKQLNGFHDNIRIMPLVVSCSGDEYDKDITMAIRYAVDNGAKVINMSFGKQFSTDSEWIQEAFKYAEEHNVLLVHGSGNNKFNVDENPYYPSDYNYKEKREISDNFINVGSISKRTDSTMVSSFSNYGKNNVDLFAPGEEIYVAAPNNEYKTDSGTSLAAPMVSGTAALIWLYYPNLTVQEVKNIILESGVTIDKKVIKPGTKNETVHFSELCKTGKVLNTYNAMKMAEQMSKKKKQE
jgi:cell wall-associated protease